MFLKQQSVTPLRFFKMKNAEDDDPLLCTKILNENLHIFELHNSLWLHCVHECLQQTKKVLFMVVANHQLAAAFRHRVRPVWRLRTASKQIWQISHKKTISQLQPRMNVKRLLVYINHVVRYVTNINQCFGLWIRYDFSWFEVTLECGRVPVSESCG